MLKSTVPKEMALVSIHDIFLILKKANWRNYPIHKLQF